MKIPKQLQFHLFSHTEEGFERGEVRNQLCLYPPFIHEVAYYEQLQAFQPWIKENVQDSVKLLFSEWKRRKESIEQYVQIRNADGIREEMVLSVQLFIECLYWVNEQPVNFEQGLIHPNIHIHPFNVEDRLTFILKRMNGYHSYKQLEELFKELEKQFAIKLIKRN